MTDDPWTAKGEALEGTAPVVSFLLTYSRRLVVARFLSRSGPNLIWFSVAKTKKVRSASPSGYHLLSLSFRRPGSHPSARPRVAAWL